MVRFILTLAYAVVLAVAASGASDVGALSFGAHFDLIEKFVDNVDVLNVGEK